MKKKISILLIGLMALGLVACGGNANTAVTENNVATETESVSEIEQEETEEEKSLVVYFSATGTTKGVAQKIASALGADIYEIKPAQPYTADDLNYSDSNSRSTREQNDSAARPEISGSAPSFAGYDKIYIGYPIWWGEEPRIMDTFVESYNFSGITMIPFCTSGGSGVGRSDSNLASRAGSGNWKSGIRFSSGVSESEIKSWADGIQ